MNRAGNLAALAAIGVSCVAGAQQAQITPSEAYLPADPAKFHKVPGYSPYAGRRYPTRPLFGDQHVHGMEGVRFYTRGKVVTTRWPDADALPPGFHMPTLG